MPFLKVVFMVASKLLQKRITSHGGIQILMYDIGYDVPTSWHGLVCPVYVAWFTQSLYY